MEYKRLGRAGIKLSELSFGTWLTFHRRADQEVLGDMVRTAFEAGVNFFDCAEVYADGEAEELLGRLLEEYPREELVVSTKLFWGGRGPNDRGLSWKHLMEGTDRSLRRLGLDYVDLLFCHRPDPDTPIEETVRAMDVIVRSGRAFYWGTSEWSAEEIEEAHRWARELCCVPPAMEQPQYSMLVRERVEREYAPLYERFGMGTTVWSPLASGILTGKYSGGVPRGSRMQQEEWLRDRLTPENLARARRVAAIAEELGCTPAQLAIAWCLKNPHVSTVITGATAVAQLRENLAAADVAAGLEPGVMARIDEALRQGDA